MTKVVSKKETKDFDFRTIKTFEDACKKMSLDPMNLPDVSMLPEKHQNALINAYKLFIIFEAINNGWTPDWNNHGQYKYFPWFEVKATKSLSSGFGFSYSDYGYYCTYADVCSRLCTDTSEKAIYIGKQFREEYKEYFLVKQ